MRGRVPFTAGGKDYSLRFGFNAMARYQEQTGEKVLAALRRLETDPEDLLLLRRLFWVALEQECSETDAGDLIDEIGIQEMGELLGRAVQATFPASEGQQGGNPRKAPATSSENG